MKLACVTITGADESVVVSDLADMSEKYPLVEWGVLFSQKRQGKEPRYPASAWLRNLDDHTAMHPGQMNVSAHLCGKWARDAIAGINSFGSTFFKCANRYQVNMTDEDFGCLDFITLSRGRPGPELCIIQTKRPFERANELWVFQGRFQMLFDASGGRGISPAEWPKPTIKSHPLLSGYAGGISYHNIKETLKQLDDVAGDAIIWIDMESGVRNVNGRFCLTFVEHILDVCSAHG